MADDGDKRHLRRQTHADAMGREQAVANLGEGWIAHAHVHAEGQTGSMQLIPHRRKTRVT